MKKNTSTSDQSTDNGMHDDDLEQVILEDELDQTSVSHDSAQSPKHKAAQPNQSDAKIAELTNDLQRTRADFENFRKQVELQRAQAMSYARDDTVRKFLPLIDDMSRAFSAYPEQLKPLEKNFTKTLHDLGLQIIDSDPGTDFNPDYHEAVSVEDDGSGDLEVVSETLRPGYLYDGSVLRAAMVRVKKTSPAA